MAKKKEETVEETKVDATEEVVEEKSEAKTAENDAQADSSPVEEENAEESVVDTVVETAGDVVEAVVETATDVVEAVVETATDVVEAVAGSDDQEETDGKTGRKRAEKVGIVFSDKMTNTVVVRVNRMVKHQLYHKYMKKRKKFMAHDELGASVGDRVRIVETRPLSARKRWRVVEIIQKAAK
jgi:small subunit ribosomal protein S17